MANYSSDNLTITGPAEDIERIVATYSSKIDHFGGTEGLLLDGEKIFPFPEGIDPDESLGMPRANWKRDNWGIPAHSHGCGFGRVSPNCVKGVICTRWNSPEGLYFEVSKRHPHCLIAVKWWSESGDFGLGKIVAGVVVHHESDLDDEGNTPVFQMVWDIIRGEITAGSSDADIGKVMKTVNRIEAGIVDLESIQSHRESLRMPIQKKWAPHEFTTRLRARSSDSEIRAVAIAIETLCESTEPVEALINRLKDARTGLLWQADFDASPVH